MPNFIFGDLASKPNPFELTQPALCFLHRVVRSAFYFSGFHFSFMKNILLNFGELNTK